MAPLLAQQRQKWAERCHAHGLSLMGAHALALLEMHGPMPMSRLADDLGVALPTPPASSDASRSAASSTASMPMPIGASCWCH
jgi:hypothetical protein